MKLSDYKSYPPTEVILAEIENIKNRLRSRFKESFEEKKIRT